MRVLGFDWDDGNVEHVGAHGVDPDEAEEVFLHAPLIRRARSGRYVALGKSATGRRLAVIFERRGAGIVRVVTARPMTRPEHRLFERKGR